MKFDRTMGIGTKAIHEGCSPDPQTGAVSTPIYQSSTFAFRDADHGADLFSGKQQGYIYTRIANPTTVALEKSIAGLEGGAGAIALASGLAAVLTTYLALLKAGDHVVCGDALYGPSRLLLEKHLSRFGVLATFVDTSNSEAVAAAVRPETRIIYCETPANPTMRVTDIAACARIAHAADAILVVDNTFLSPVLQRPIELGADVVIHSLTKFLNGHADVVAGVLVCASAALLERIRPVHINCGAIMDPHQAWLVSRGLKTLSLRINAAQESAARLAVVLERHPAVSAIAYPGLESHPQRELIKRQMLGPGSLMSFELAGGLEAGKRLMNAVKVATLAVSLGGIETLIQHPASMTHFSMGREARLAAGISDGLVRLSVGCEDYADLEWDMLQALDQC